MKGTEISCPRRGWGCYTSLMRWFIGILIVVGIALYSTIGIRLGLLPDIPMTIWNANGTNTYSYQVRSDKAKLEVFLETEASSGSIEVQFLNPQGAVFYGFIVGGQSKTLKQDKDFTLNPGAHKVIVKFNKASGFLSLNWRLADYGK
jgi:hypothetical protein